jgi:hypothetical protein
MPAARFAPSGVPFRVLFAIGLIASVHLARAGDALVLNQRLPTLDALGARAPAGVDAVASSEPMCDIFANGYDVPGATPCAGCFDTAVDFNESDVDCGGTDCKACMSGQQCIVGSDCQSGKCSSGLCADVLLISQVQTRGTAGGNDEFVELYNPTEVPVIFDSTWTLAVRNASIGLATCATNTLTARFIGSGQVIVPHGHLLFVTSSYNGATIGNATYDTSITDAASMVLQHDGTVADALCFYSDASSLATLNTCPSAYTCEGAPVFNPHDNSSGTNIDASITRKPGGTGGNMQDTDDNATDFYTNLAPDPRNAASSPTP